MAHPIVGFLQDQGYSEGEVSDMLSPMELEEDMPTSGVPSQSAASFASLGTPAERYDAGSVVPPATQPAALRAILTAASEDRKPPGPQVIVPTGCKAVPNAKPVRVDTEQSFRNMKKKQRSGGHGRRGSAHSSGGQDSIDALIDAGQRELMGEMYVRPFETDELLSGMYERRITESEEIGNDDFYIRPQELAELLGADQVCIVCGGGSPGSAICPNCRVSVLGMYIRPQERAELFVGFEGRGTASAIYNNAGGDFYIRPQELSEILGDVMALETPLAIYDQPEEKISLSFSQPEAYQHVASWQQGPNLYSSIRLTGWDGAPRILTGTMPYAKSLGVVVGYAKQANVAPAHLLAMAHGLTQQLGASSIIPRLAAASPRVLDYVDGKNGPLIVSTAPAGR